MISIVAVHGNGGGGFRFSRMHEHMPDGVKFVAVTLPGFGGRPADPSLQTVADYAEALYREICELPQPIVLLGHGIGGTIALDMIQRHRVAGLILHAPVGTRLEQRLFPRLMKPPLVRRLVQWGISSRLTRPLLRRRFFDGSVPPEYSSRFLAEYGRAEAFGQMFDIINSSWWASLSPSMTPTILLWGAKDRVLGADQVNDYRRLLPQHTVDVVPGWGHFPMSTDPEGYTSRVVEWAQQLVHEPPQFLVLGSGTSADTQIAPKAAMLDRAKHEGLRVPEGIIVPDGSEVNIPSWLGDSLAVRSAFGAEDGATESHAGYYDTVLRVPHDEVPTAAEKVRASADPSIRRDVLIMEMVDATTSGVAFSEPGYADDLVEWTTGTAEELVAGEKPARTSLLPRLLAGVRSKQSTGWKARLQQLLGEVRVVFGDRSWDIEWADNGKECYLIQIRPVTVPTRRDEWFTMANHREILPDPPSVFMTSILAEGSHELLDYYRRFDPELTRDRLFIEVFDHRPMINLSLMTDFMRSLGLPTKLVTDSIGGGAVVQHGPSPMRAISRLPVLLRLAGAQMTSSRYADARLGEMRRMTAQPATNLEEAVGRARKAFVATVHGMTALNTAAAAPAAILKAVGTLEAHSARHETAATRMFRELSVLRKSLTEADRELLAAGRLPQSSAFAAAWEEWLQRYGHRGAYESDLARPRYSEDPRPILDSLATGRAFPSMRPKWTLRQLATLPLWWLVRVPMSRRERYRSEAMRVFQLIRSDLRRLAATHEVGEGALWMLTADEVRRLDSNWRPTPALLDGRSAELAEAKSRPMPNLISRFSSPVGAEHNGDAIGLVAGQLQGRAWVLNEPATQVPAEIRNDRRILVAPSVDAGWLATFSLVDGVAVEMGGNLSHGSIILRELGLPAVTNAAGLRTTVSTGDLIRIDGGTGVVELVERPQ